MNWKLLVLTAFLVAVLCGSTGCCGSLNAQFVKATDSNWKVMGPNYRAYVEGDEALTEGSKNRRLAAIDEFTALVAQAKAKVDE